MITIGITCSHQEEEMTGARRQKMEHYRLMLQDAGATAKIIFLPDAQISPLELARTAVMWGDQLQGLVLSGGGDLPAQMFGATPDPALGELVPPLRPALEKELIEKMLARDKAVLGICYGAQLLNVLEGGTLIQDIPSHCPHALEHREGVLHEVRTEPESPLRQWLGESFEVASYHHQSIAEIAPTARLAALAPDGIIEAVEFPQHRFCMGVQWHPERTRESVATRQLMKKFVDACR